MRGQDVGGDGNIALYGQRIFRGDKLFLAALPFQGLIGGDFQRFIAGCKVFLLRICCV